MSGKGSTARPFVVDQDTFTSNWDRTFGAKSQDSQNKVGKRNEPESDPAAEVSRPAEGLSQ